MTAPRGVTALTGGLVIALAAGILRAETLSTTETVDLEDVYCALCHFDEGDDFAASVHYQRGLLLCNDCHGGLPFESDEEIAKAADTGFIGKPSRDQIAEVCSQCHMGPAEFLAVGPHHDWHDPGNATCVSCHSNHRVQSADLSLMDSTCETCHSRESTAMTTGTSIRELLESSRSLAELVRSEFDSLSIADAKLQREKSNLRAAFASLRQADGMTHAWDPDLIADQVSEFKHDLDLVESRIQERKEDKRLRLWLVAGIWVFVAVNLVLLWRQRNSQR